MGAVPIPPVQLAAIQAFSMKDSDRLQASANSLPFLSQHRYIVLFVILWSASGATQRAWPDAAKPTRGSCLNPATGLGGTFDLQQNIQYSKLYLKLHQIHRAIPCLENAHSIDPTADTHGFDVTYNLGLAYLQAGETQAAKSLVENQLRTQDKAALHDLLGMIETTQHHFHAASMQYQIAAQEDASEQNIFDFGTSLLKFQGNSAEKIFRYGVAKYPGSVRMHVGLGSALYAQGQTTEAAQEMCAAARIDPSDPHPMEMVGKTEQVLPSLASEITARFAALVRLYPQNGKLLYYYAMALSGMWSGQASASPRTATLLQRAVVLDPHLAKAHFYLAQIEEQRKQFTRAIENYRKAADLSPTNDQYLYRLAFAYKEAGNQPMFQKELQKFRMVHQQTKKSE